MHDERVRILSCIGNTQSPALVKRVIDLSFSDFVRKQDRLRPLISLSRASPIGRRAVWQEIRQRIDTLEEDLGVSSLMGYVIKVSVHAPPLGSTVFYLNSRVCSLILI